jgi:hypothetical protein
MRGKRLSAMVAAAMTMVSAVFLAPSSAEAAGATAAELANPYYIHLSGRLTQCIDDPHGSMAEGTQMIIYGCKYDQNQEWYFVPLKNPPGAWNIYNGKSKKCLATTGLGAGQYTNIVQSECSTRVHKIWYPVLSHQADGTGYDYYYLRTGYAHGDDDGLCLSTDYDMAPSTPLIVDECRYSTTWTWSNERLPLTSAVAHPAR